MRSGLIIIVIAISLVSLYSCKNQAAVDEKKPGNTVKIKQLYINAKDGLRMRNNPDVTGTKTGLIPFGTKVEVTEEKSDEITLAGAKGKWSKIKWNKKTGWVFGGFLQENKPVALSDAQCIQRLQDCVGNETDIEKCLINETTILCYDNKKYSEGMKTGLDKLKGKNYDYMVDNCQGANKMDLCEYACYLKFK
ncbi:MAG: SH3 domain-containing protein [bacterium]|nr:SH3 domain-containing protein [bacterium]